MGTRADFYIGRGESAEWLGSIAWDGYPGGMPSEVLYSDTETRFREHVERFLSERDHATFPDQGWPWPWNDSGTTDYSYAFDGGHVYASPFGRFWFKACEQEPSEEDHPDLWESKGCEFPDMSDRKSVARGCRSGLIEHPA